MPGLYRSGNWNENNLNPLSSINWRASLVPAAAVIPAPIAYIKVVAVKKLVVGFLAGATGLTPCSALAPSIFRASSFGSYPEGNFGGNQLLDGSISLSPLYPNLKIDLHVRIPTSLHQSFPWLRPIQA
ncbi:hypothetical protein ACHAXS_006587 [Conticribra weissflogii]